jgi:hypothetical protein
MDRVQSFVLIETFGKYTRQVTPITETVEYVEFPEETKYQTLFHDWYLSYCVATNARLGITGNAMRAKH